MTIAPSLKVTLYVSIIKAERRPEIKDLTTSQIYSAWDILVASLVHQCG
jgi:hypothetical protein